MKRALSVLVTASLLLGLAACGTAPEGAEEKEPQSAGTEVQATVPVEAPQETAPVEKPVEEPVEETPAPEEEPQELDADSLGEIQVEEELFDVKITLPADMMEGTTQEELDELVEEEIVHAAALNEDGSVTYEMSKKQHRNMLEEFGKSIRESLDEMVGSEDCPHFTKIEANDDFSHFTVTASSTELGLNESFSVVAFYMYGGLYGVMEGAEDKTVTVDFVNAETGEVFESSSSEEMQDAG